MKEYLIGTGGWAYFQIPGLHPLAAYSKAFDFVEVNSTFYRVPSFRQAEKWRAIVPQDFKFAVRAHRSITHKHHLQPTREALETLERIRKICKILNAEIIHLQTPPSLKIKQMSIDGLRNLVSSVNIGKTRVALEIRRVAPSRLPPELVKTMKELDIVHCVDLSKDETPAHKSDILYSRLFGKGVRNIYQPTDEELKEIDRKASGGKFRRVMLNFHFVRMYKDATRLKIYKHTDRFPKITKSTGLSSLEEVMGEDAEFPTSRHELVQNQGWKLFDLSEEKRVRAGNFLQALPDKTYNNIAEVIDALESVVR